MINTCQTPMCRSGPAASHCVSWGPLCEACRGQVASQLRGLPSLYQACGAALERVKPSRGERVSGWWATGISLNEAALTVRSDISHVLASWCAMVIGERNIEGPAGQRVAVLADFLAGQLDWLSAHIAAADFAAEIGELTTAARNAASQEPRLQINLGQCVEPGCRQEIRAGGGGPRAPQVSCGAGHTWPPHAWLTLSKRIEQARRLDRAQPSPRRRPRRAAPAASTHAGVAS